MENTIPSGQPTLGSAVGEGKREPYRSLRLLLLVVVLVALLTPGWVFFSEREGLAFLEGTSWQSANRQLFPLVGLYAFTLVWLQVMIGSNRRWLRRVFPGVMAWHRRQGVVTLLFALLHPTLLIGGVGFDAFLRNSFSRPEHVLFVWFGKTAAFLIVLTAGAALLRRVAWLRTRWLYIHYLNYLIFVLVWLHSWMLGSDVQTSGLKYLWLFFGAGVLISAGAHWLPKLAKKSVPTSNRPMPLRG